MTDAATTISEVRALLRGHPVFLAGSLMAEYTYQMDDAHSDVDLFCPTGNVLVATTQYLIDEGGYTFDDRMERTWYRWLRYGFKSWHTNSMRLTSPSGMETNLVYKLTEGHATTSLAQVLESFDFGLLATGWDLESDTYRDLRRYLFPAEHQAAKNNWKVGDPWPLHIPLPMMPNKRDNWRQGFISQYNGVREVGRYAKYYARGYDLSLVKDDLVTGYKAGADYLTTCYEKDKQELGMLYDVIAQHIDADNIDHLIAAHATIDYKDSLDSIMEALE